MEKYNISGNIDWIETYSVYIEFCQYRRHNVISYYHKILLRQFELRREYVSQIWNGRLMQSKEHFPGTSMRATDSMYEGMSLSGVQRRRLVRGRRVRGGSRNAIRRLRRWATSRRCRRLYHESYRWRPQRRGDGQRGEKGRHLAWLRASKKAKKSKNTEW